MRVDSVELPPPAALGEADWEVPEGGLGAHGDGAGTQATARVALQVEANRSTEPDHAVGGKGCMSRPSNEDSQ
eukprot:4329504-Prorocentrum_lima.AAC.1